MPRKKPVAPVLADDEDSGMAAVGCLGALAVMVAVGVAIALFVDFSGTEEESGRASGELPITRVEALDKATSDQASGQALARNLEAGDSSGIVVGRASVINGLFADFYEHGVEPETLTRELDRRAVCFNGRHARIGPLVLAPETRGFALTFGALTYADGNPYPRLEFSHGISEDLNYVYYVSLTEEPIRGFEPQGIRIPNTREAVGRVMLEWVAEVANAACPPPVAAQ
ncbi:hypothetical protein [Rhodospira trueperi]|uniref:Uncharacterized protein n=1 Tax=Rhodospira trueperi TaxID=69960 RepID=A0A1G7BNV8_9PROT|nr:hypothetical protein [Rhodospira trueperi]SDE28657.1 hypothetical protein SAMN05421720_105112 [Rhodospira trueperi]